jgi:fatty acid desaturase
MADAGADPCRRCGRAFGEGESPDPNGWCARCRAELVGRSTRWAWLPALVFAALFFLLVAWGGLLGSRFLVVWLALGVALAWVAFKVARRVLFDVLRVRMLRGGRR